VKKLHIKEKLENIGVAVDGIIMGDFDFIGEFTAKRQRSPDDPNYKKYGAFYRSNYERGILIYHLIRQFELTSMLEIGFGRGYATFCAAKAFYDSGKQGKIFTIDPALEERHLRALSQVIPEQLFEYVNFLKGTSTDVIPTIEERFDLVYVDGDHSYRATKNDWNLVREKFDKFVLFDDYLLPTKDDPGIKCNAAIDEINEEAEGCDEKELIIMDRRMFFDDRRFADDQIDYGQVLLTKKGTCVDGDW
jgi:caffeoyl-CoA O-methyltransferase